MAAARVPGLSMLLALGLGAGACDGGDARGYDVARAPVTIRGVGSAASRALFVKWAEQYAQVDPATTVTYDAAGSGAGVQAALEGSAAFGVSDAPLSDADATAHRGFWSAPLGPQASGAAYADVLHLPVAVEAIAVVYALAGAGASRLQISEDVLADMLTGRTRYWDDPALAAQNPGSKLPHVAVRPLYRGDESGSSYRLAEWLSKTSKRWGIQPSRSIVLAGGAAVQKEAGMLAGLRADDGALGYLSAATAMSEHVTSFAVRNPAGRFVPPSLEGLRAAAATADLGPDLRADPIAAPGDLSYPVCSFTFVLLRADGEGGRRALARFLWWATHDGQAFAPPLGFGALPGELQLRDEGVLHALRAAGGPAL